MRMTRSELDALIRHDFMAFVELSFRHLVPADFLPNWHLEKICEVLENCRLGRIRRLIITVPPRSLKSICASVSFPAWLLGHNPGAQIICASYSQDLAEKHARDCRKLMLSDRYRQLFPTRLSAEKLAASEFVTTANGVRLATSVGGQLTGRGADFIILDDCLKPDEALSVAQRTAVNEWYDSTLLSRLNNKKVGSIIMIQQRLHEDDIVGHVLGKENWTLLRLPAIAEENEIHVIKTAYDTRTVERKEGEALHPAREPIEVLENIRQTLGPYHFAAQYQQAPAPHGGGMIKTEWFKRFSDLEQPEKFEFIFESWDTANKANELSDYCVCTTWGVKNHHLYLLHVLRKKMLYPALKKTLVELALLYKPKHILIEDRASGTQLIQELIHEGVYGVTRFEPEGEKIMRMDAGTGMIENGFVHLPEKAPWLNEFLSELQAFPKGKFDDQVDSVSQALKWIKSRQYTRPALIEFCRQQNEMMKNLPPTPRNLYRNGGEDLTDSQFRSPDFLFPRG